MIVISRLKLESDILVADSKVNLIHQQELESKKNIE